MFGAIAWGALGGTQLDHENTKSVPMQRGARPVFCRSVPMQRGARFLIFGERSMAQHGVDEGVKNIYSRSLNKRTPPNNAYPPLLVRTPPL